ncbi:aromatic acid exporter family protein [Pseudonocardia sp. RS11V-5]|uniref:FUSC family protein n=1 Tax=Pseudonocardia terrae TaxID=2905831 RepID=UPI001E642584|nr:aromatic acid exporter family protein [Pseudonocardia terrae]MCE3551037.1 aromatic acid exporter family protein [Pseudonocardia terrae]
MPVLRDVHPWGAVRAALPREGPSIVRIVVAAAVSWEVCVWLGATQPPVYAVIVPLVAIRDAPGSALNVSLARLVGVVAGLALGIGVLAWLRPSALTVALVLAVALVIGMVLRIGDALNTQVAVSALLVFANADPASYAVARLWETAVGAAVTVVLAPLLLPTNPARSFVAALHEVADGAAADLLLAADLPTDPADPARDELAARLTARTHRSDDAARRLPDQLATARRAVRLHPLWRRRHTAELAALVEPAAAAAEVTVLVRVHVADVVELGRRPDTCEWWAASAPRTRAVVTPLAAAVAAGLRGTPDRDALTQAATAVAAHSAADHSALGGLVRRPLRRIVRLLTELAGK